MKLFNDTLKPQQRGFLFCLLAALICAFCAVGAFFESIPLLGGIYLVAAVLFVWCADSIYPASAVPVPTESEQILEGNPTQKPNELQAAVATMIQAEIRHEAIVVDVTASTATVAQPGGELKLVPCHVLRACDCAVGERIPWPLIETLKEDSNLSNLDRWRLNEYKEWMSQYAHTV